MLGGPILIINHFKYMPIKTLEEADELLPYY